ncbi:MAG: hypothetical protein Q8P52_00895 [bacterium]|nr:hypothetical protein [bacterium]
MNFFNIEYLFQKIYDLFQGKDLNEILRAIAEWLMAFLEKMAPFSFAVSVLLVAGIIYCSIRITQIREAEKAIYGPRPETSPVSEVLNRKWQMVLEHLESEKESDWRLAILEADIMLDEMLEGQGYHADTLADKLKMIEPSDFTTLDFAWTAHKVRNQIAHEGSAFQLTHREAKKVVSLFEKVFKEFKYI